MEGFLPISSMPRLDFRPAIQDPVFLVITRHQIESGDTQDPMVFLQHLVSCVDTALQFMGRVSLIVDGYNDDARELFEIPAETLHPYAGWPMVLLVYVPLSGQLLDQDSEELPVRYD
jgi:hypothetical protein